MIQRRHFAFHLVALVALVAIVVYDAVLCAAAVPTHHLHSSRQSFPFTPPASEADAAAFLSSIECPLPPSAAIANFVFRPVVVLLVALVLVAAVLSLGPAIAAHSRQLKIDHLIASTGTVILTLSLLMALHQWHESVEQAALVNYEKEIAESNKVEERPSVRAMMSDMYPAIKQAAPDYDRSEYVYLQLDNLEYALERYRDGLASAYTTSRAVMTFAVHCQTQEFRQRVVRQVAVASYSPVTVDVVFHVIERFLKSEKAA